MQNFRYENQHHTDVMISIGGLLLIDLCVNHLNIVMCQSAVICPDMGGSQKTCSNV